MSGKPKRSPAAPRVWQRMLSGRRLDLADPSPFDIEIEDIAHGLARVARWNGQTTGPHAFSVAQHSVLVEAIFSGGGGGYPTREPSVSAADSLAALLHDAPEYVIGDMISPFKALIGGEYRAIESRLLAAIHLRFGLPAERSPKLVESIKEADRVAAYFEAVELAGFDSAEAESFFGRPSGFSLARLSVDPWPTAEAEKRFTARFQALSNALSAESVSA
ncbi:HD family hydrolase [Kaistia dalseonensis]|uniref:5'-deoxynucleotidase YfbR-like HD superfamily hydrolase n=1 Tax=Kaistia dalseonensis TaxID=410840 RepID=A0ABU0HCV1_9HYPH|nr:HD family hydrolase [Kaistia dalseonensis]MCX5497510.1 HD family hydrolase [Kaistia dalseonensis]MDQ0440149.1 5'-deoxynucleotidase YfbR-like HD superfamily hydrolase [Kaistia dalseonensis]